MVMENIQLLFALAWREEGVGAEGETVLSV